MCMKKNIHFLLFNIGIFILILDTSYAWMFWNISSITRALLYVTIFVIGFLYFQKQKSKCRKSVFFILAVIFLFLAHVMKTGSSFLGIAQVLLYMILMWFVMVLPVNQKNEMLVFQTKITAILLLISFIAWIAHYFYPLPYTEIQRSGFDYLRPAQNYVLFITSSKGLLDYRFHSIFLEPGHLGMIISFLVIANQFNFKNKYVLILSILLLFTLSLAGFVIFFIGFLLYSLTQNRKSKVIRWMLGGGLAFLGIWLFGIYYEGGDNYVNVRFVERLQYDEDTGSIAGDKRYTEEIERTFDKTINSSDALFGISIINYRHFRETAGDGAGIKLWIIQRGIIGTLVLFLGYYFIARGSRNRRWAMLMLLVYAISSYQRMYFFWASYLIPFICGSALPLFQNKNSKNILT